MRTSLSLLILFSLLPAMATAIERTSMTNEEVLESVKGAAPEGLAEHATIMNIDAKGKMNVIRQGSNGWTCMDPGGAPMCADKAGMEFLHALLEKGAAPQKLGFIYMLKGDNGASNTDPYASKETPDNNWVNTGPHVMIVGAEAKTMTQAYPRDAKPDATKPYVMWPGTPYEHLMLPVR